MIDTTALVDDFYDPSGRPVNPWVEQAEDIVVDWLWRIGFVCTPAQEKHLRSFRFGLYHGIATPEADLDRLVLGLMWFCWGSLADDQYDNYVGAGPDSRMRGVLRDLSDIIAGMPVRSGNSHAVIAGFAEFWPRLMAGLDAEGRRRAGVNFMDYLQAIAFQNSYHTAGRVPDSATFLMMRRHTIAMVFQADILEAVCRIQVPSALRESLLFREMVWCFADITAWHNDVYGLEKDIADGQTCNMVRVVAASEGCDLAEAVARTLSRAAERQRLLLRIEADLPEMAAALDLPAEAAAAGRELARALRAYVYANLVWIGETRRYDLDLPRIAGTFDDVITGAVE
jgi:5-epi-alpha-selinene synthase